MKDRHIIEALGKSQVIIEDGKVVEVSEPVVTYCPIFHAAHNIQKIDKEKIRKNIEFRIDKFGMCTKDRLIRLEDMLTVGVSEILKTNLEEKNIDCVVGVCEGVGTMIITEPDIVQGVGGRVSGLISTTPIPELIEKFESEENVILLNPKDAELNPLKGLQLAIDNGFKDIAITILPSPIIEKLRNYPTPDDVNVYIFVAHTTAANDEEVKICFENADIVTACASKAISDYADIHKPYYYGSKVPIYCATEHGRKFLDCRLKKIGKALSTNEYPKNKEGIPNPLV